jgi:hypothetical protein
MAHIVDSIFLARRALSSDWGMEQRSERAGRLLSALCGCTHGSDGCQ